MDNLRRTLFEELGKLFYAIAKSQGVNLMGLGSLKMLLHRDWLRRKEQVNLDVLSEETHRIMYSMDTQAGGEGATAEEAFEGFEAFYKQHPDVFDDSLRALLVSTGRDIVNYFPGSSGNQNNQLIKLESLLRN